MMTGARRPLLFALVLAMACTSAPQRAGSSVPSILPLTSMAQGIPLPGVMFGVRAKPRWDQNQQQAITALEEIVGRRFDADRIYKRWDHVFPIRYAEWTRDLGRTVFLSVRARTTHGTIITWKSIADADVGSPLHKDMVRWGNALKTFGKPIYVTFHHEPDGINSRGNGTPGDFIRAWRRFHRVVQRQGATNVIWLWTLTAATFGIDGYRSPDHWYPGDAYVNHIGADGYNWFGCRTGVLGGQWRSFREIFDPVRRWAMAHPGKKIFAPEWGSQEDPAAADRKSEWIADAMLTLQEPEWGAWGGMLYFHAEDPHPQNAYPCAWWVDSSLSSLRAFKAMAAATITGQ